jgi:hypothetical protein
MGGELTESGFELMTSESDTMLNYHLSQKFKLIGIGKFNHLINILTLFSHVWAQTHFLIGET